LSAFDDGFASRIDYGVTDLTNFQVEIDVPGLSLGALVDKFFSRETIARAGQLLWQKSKISQVPKATQPACEDINFRTLG
jgi:hypothetical protein